MLDVASLLATEDASSSSSSNAEEVAARLLVHLEKELRSTVLANQVEAVAWFSRLLQEYPLPVIINTAVLKLCDNFRTTYIFPKLSSKN